MRSPHEDVHPTAVGIEDFQQDGLGTLCSWRSSRLAWGGVFFGVSFLLSTDALKVLTYKEKQKTWDTDKYIIFKRGRICWNQQNIKIHE